MQIVDGVEMLGVREAAAYVQRTPETVRRWVWSGRLSAQRDGNRLLVSRRELDAVLGMDDAPALSLQAWAAGLPDGKAASAADLVLEDRTARDGR